MVENRYACDYCGREVSKIDYTVWLDTGLCKHCLEDDDEGE